MKTIETTIRLPFALLAVLLSGAALQAAPLASWDFQDGTVGAAPSGTGVLVYRAASGNAVTINGGASIPADPFGGAGNQSLYLSYPAGGASKYPTAQFSLPSESAPLAAGTLTFDLYVVGTGATPGLIEVDLGVFNSTSANNQRASSLAAIQVWTNSETTADSSKIHSGNFLEFSGGTNGSSNLHAFNEQVLIGAKNTIAISWDANAGTYSVSLNGVLVTQGTGSSIVDSFGLTTPQAGVSDVRFTTANASDTSYFIDNISINTAAIPEPGATAAVAAGAVMLGVLTIRLRR